MFKLKFLPIFLLMLLTFVSCDETPYSIIPTDMPPSEIGSETTLPPPTSAEQIPPEIDPPAFDPLNPDGWAAREWILRGISYNEGKYIEGVTFDDERKHFIFYADFVIGNFYIELTFDEAALNFPFESYTKSERVIEGTDIIIKTITFNNFELSFWNFDNIRSYNGFLLMSIEVSGAEHTTTRGLRVGDTAERVYKLYGIPSFVSSKDSEFAPNTWYYNMKFEENSNFRVVVVDGIVESFLIHGFL